MDNNRPAIPAEIRRRVLVEAGHRCAIPTCRYIQVDIHHIIPWEKCQAHEYENLIALCPNCHQRADREEIDRKSLRLYKANLRFAHDKFSQAELDILFDLFRAPAGASIQWPPVNNVFIKRILEAGYISIHKAQGVVMLNGMQASPDYLVITDKGRAFVTELGLHEL